MFYLAGELPVPIDPDLLQASRLLPNLNPHQRDVLSSPSQGHQASRLRAAQTDVSLLLAEGNI